MVQGEWRGRIRIKKMVAAVLGGVCTSVAIGSQAVAINIDWHGSYRAEGIRVSNVQLSSFKVAKAYMLHHFVLQPKIIAADGVNIYGRFDILNHSLGYPSTNNVFGQFLGSGPGTTTPASQQDSNVLSRTQNLSPILVTELYLNYIGEFGSLMVGRVPMAFGMGMTYHSGDGFFDHWIDTKDVVAYKIVFGNFFLIPMIGKINEGALASSDDVDEFAAQLEYHNADNKLAMGLFFEKRTSSKTGNDAPKGDVVSGGFGDAGVQAQRASFSTTQFNIFIDKEVSGFHFGVEAGFNNGKSGVLTAKGENIDLNGFGIAAQADYQGSGSNWRWSFLTGVASGDDPNTADTYEGFIFDRNYEIAMLLFNHQLGRYDVLRTSLNHPFSPTSNVDVEAVSNAFYIAPGMQYNINDNWDLKSNWAWARIHSKPLLAGDIDGNLGFEWDAAVSFHPHDRLIWSTSVGLLFPGVAFKGGSTNNYPTKFVYGLSTQLGVRF